VPKRLVAFVICAVSLRARARSPNEDDAGILEGYARQESPSRREERRDHAQNNRSQEQQQRATRGPGPRSAIVTTQ
jgi:hypothetical protein